MISQNALLRSLKPTDYEALHRHLEPVGLRPGEVLYEPEDTVDWVYFPEAGLVSLISVMVSGDQVESAVVGREGGIGFLEAAGAGIIFSKAVVQVDLVGQRAPARAYLAAYDASPSLRRTIAAHVELTLAEARQTIACIAHHPAQQRLAWWLLECQERTGRDEFRLTQEFLSAMLGVRRSTVSLIAAELKGEGLIGYSRGAIRIADREGLLAKSCECYATNRRFRELIEGPDHDGASHPRRLQKQS
ncbi:MAG TPA: Crp/Fnr family transcriptional regulator [Phenylobacterium sp.]|uniref:Crp/Fnr family transcriptional regulator n=1 Tax=Phenylobacterium sp. TaxID=1871053 RepID=UPI002C2DC718|nr:Crp/Fnr family transcriptional regulator [Phenylobacterium sp.]HSV04433.1 Crp/Fnr family transcriptional regulator [Phenylobacterium sp.]